MAKHTSRSRPTYRPNSELFARLLNQSGKSIVDYAHDINCGETTLRKLLANERVAAETLKAIADRLKRHWHELLSESEKERIGVARQATVASSQPVEEMLARGSTDGPTASPAFSCRLFQLPAALADFTGRQQQVAELTSQLCGDESRIRRFVLHGMGGIGKTVLAITVAHQSRDHFPDAQLFVDLHGADDDAPTTPVEAMSRIIHAFDPAATGLPNDGQELASHYRSILAGKHVLIVLDNARSEDQVRPLLTAPPPAGFLVTSRAALALDGTVAFQIGLFSGHEAQELLRRILGRKGSTAELNRIAELCGYLPLAVRVAGDFLRLKDNWPTCRYVEALEQEQLRWLKIGTDQTKNVEERLRASAIHIQRDAVDRANRWHLLHVFEGDFDLPAAAAMWNADQNDPTVLDDLSDLKNRGLIFFDTKTSRYHLHKLMRPIANKLLDDPEPKCRK